MEPRNQKDDLHPEDGLERELDSIRAHLSAHAEQEPPALLDQAVLNTARRELAGRRRRQVRWIGAFATVSVLVLALTLVVQQSQVPIAPSAGEINDLRLAPVSKSETPSQERNQMDTSGGADQVADETADREDARQRSAKVQLAAPAKNEAEPQKSMAGQSRRGLEEKLDEAADADQGHELHKQVITAETKEVELNSYRGDPDEWIARMLALSQDKQFEQLRLELDAFQAAYPDYPLPPELADSAR